MGADPVNNSGVENQSGEARLTGTLRGMQARTELISSFRNI